MANEPETIGEVLQNMRERIQSLSLSTDGPFVAEAGTVNNFVKPIYTKSTKVDGVTQKYLEETKDITNVAGHQYQSRRERIVCNDGFSMSVQAGEALYCTPRDNHGPWDSVEIGYPSALEPLILGWAETPEDPKGSVYGFVPISVCDAVIAMHSGIASPIVKEQMDKSRNELTNPTRMLTRRQIINDNES
jgi:hypothetical protein